MFVNIARNLSKASVCFKAMAKNVGLKAKAITGSTYRAGFEASSCHPVVEVAVLLEGGSLRDRVGCTVVHQEEPWTELIEFITLRLTQYLVQRLTTSAPSCSPSPVDHHPATQQCKLTPIDRQTTITHPSLITVPPAHGSALQIHNAAIAIQKKSLQFVKFTNS